jgi:hypothetical protein
MLVVPRLVYNANKQWEFGVKYVNEDIRPLTRYDRGVFNASNGWKLILGWNGNPRIDVTSKLVYCVATNGNEVFDEVDVIVDFPRGASEVAKAIKIAEIIEAFKEMSKEELQAIKLAYV